MKNIVTFVILFYLLNVTTLLTHATSCRSNDAHSPEINPFGTPAILTLNNFSCDEDIGGASVESGVFFFSLSYENVLIDL